jgi:ATP-dependent helicase HrpB
MLPLLAYRQKIQEQLFRHKKLIITAPPGTGKSTQIPQFFAGQCSPEKKLIMLEPRRIAARSLAYRVAEEMGKECGGEVGYQVRFERKSSEKTKILFLTYGTFLQLLHSDPLSVHSSIIVFDEFHERSLEADTALAWVRFLAQSARRDGEIMVLSATLEVEPLQKYLDGCAAIDIPDKAFPVDLRYQPPASSQEPMAKQLERALAGLLGGGEQGSVLVFLPGVYEIERAAEALYDQCRRKGYRLMQLHGRMPLSEQQLVLRLPGKEPCVILSTNVAETSLTVPGVSAVIDSGFARVASFDPERERNTLYLSRISRQNAQQRAGRAGRLAEGVCIRLWSREDEQSMPKAIQPEMLRLDLSKTMLTLCAFSGEVSGGNKSIEFFSAPPAERWEMARNELLRCGAIVPYLSDDNTIRYDMVVSPLTDGGKAMSRLPLEPAVAAVLLQSRSPEERMFNAAMAAILESGSNTISESRDLFELAADFINDGKGTAIGKEVRETCEQLVRLLRDVSGSTSRKPLKPEGLRKEVSSVWMRIFSHRIAVRTGDTSLYEFLNKMSARLIIGKSHGKEKTLPSIVLALIVHEQAGRVQARKTVIPLYLPLEAEWLAESFPGELSSKVECRWDEVRQRVNIHEILQFRGIILRSREIEDRTLYREQTVACLAGQLCKGAWDWKKDDVKAEQFIYRLRQVSAAYPEMKIPRMTEDDLELIYHDLSDGKLSLEEIKKSSMLQAMQTYIGGRHAGFIEKKAPDIIILPSGKKGRITYFDNAPPELSARLGDLIGYKERFMLMDGRVQGVFDILAPNYRTVQKTSDLGSFWKNVYPSIKNGLKRKYPRHPWP